MKVFRPGGPSLVEGRWRLLRVTAARRVDHAPTDVWTVVSDHTTWTSWHEDYDEHEAIGEAITGLGARFRTREWVLRSESEVVRWEPGTAIGLTVLRARGLGWLLTSYYSELTVEPIDGQSGCVIRYRAGFTGSWLFWFLSAYTISQSLGGIYLDARSSLKRLDRYLSDRIVRPGSGGGDRH